MDLFEAVKGRRSIRKFKQDRVDEDDLEKILDAGRHAPSAGNCQPLELVVVKDENRKEDIARAARFQSFVAEAPVVMVVCANVPRTESRYRERGRNLYCIQDTAASVQNILLAAHALGYGTCWVGSFDEEAAAKVINAPPRVRPVAIIPIGKPAEKPEPKSRFPLNKILHHETF